MAVILILIMIQEAFGNLYLYKQKVEVTQILYTFSKMVFLGLLQLADFLLFLTIVLKKWRWIIEFGLVRMEKILQDIKSF